MVSMTTFTCAMNGIFSSPSESEQSSYFREFLFHAWYRGILKSFKTWYSCTFPPLVKVPLRKKSYSLFPMQNGNLTCCLPNVPHWKFKPLLLLSGWWMRLIGNEFFSFPTLPFLPYHRFVCLSNTLLIENFIIFPDVLCFKACTETLSRKLFLSVRTPPDIFSATKTLATSPVSKSVSNHVRMHFFSKLNNNIFYAKVSCLHFVANVWYNKLCCE